MQQGKQSNLNHATFLEGVLNYTIKGDGDLYLDIEQDIELS